MDSIWPDRPTCHHGEPLASQYVPQWRDPQPDDEPYGMPYRTCSYCGSIHPEDLLHALQHGATLGGSDWKYGFPHKFYVEGIPNPQAGRVVKVGSRSGTGDNGTWYNEPIMGDAPVTIMTKFYTQHLTELSEEAFAALAPLLSERSGIEWIWNGGDIKFKAPHHGYQR